MGLSLTKEQDQSAYHYLSMDIHGNTSVLRIDPPVETPTAISDVSLMISGQTAVLILELL